MEVGTTMHGDFHNGYSLVPAAFEASISLDRTLLARQLLVGNCDLFVIVPNIRWSFACQVRHARESWAAHPIVIVVHAVRNQI